ncbi:alpha/beta fold hydrolase [Herbaspirillum sp. RTI4]|uniref:alpha/beta fold hydrolase n=1 Tax=Herbaspirillum sp. RTI4 TaxID=3048640 RepID=UPI002AB3948F|nr:alpha/beta fold hydrolase [Herbaspirillum sp. RTI4]MDY7577417.1 alpha/beta fold hydrolase [Herbaspirillum sp. RTI4]MEA9981693.1 alpha/beta fold hydrolase [Herbaspirillum sp. RTI4]
MTRDIVLLPGFMLTAGLWDDMRDGLARLGRLHFGDIGQDDTIAAMAARVLQQAPPQFVLLGFSMGGFVAQAMALQAPDRVQGLALLNTSSRPPSAMESAALQEQIALASRLPFKGLTSRKLASSLHPDRADDRVLLARLQAMALHNGKDVFLHQLAALRDDSVAALEQIACPALIVAAREDRLRTVEESEEMAQRMPKAMFRILEDSGHMTPMEQPLRLQMLLDEWLGLER